MVLAKIYCVSSSQLTSLCGESFPDCDGVLPSQENEFCMDNFLSLKFNHVQVQDSHDRHDHILNVRCRYFTTDEIRSLEAKLNKKKHDGNDISSCSHLHLILCCDYLNRHNIFPGQMVDIDRIPLTLSRVVLTANYDQKIVQEPRFLMHNSEFLRCKKEETIYVGRKSVVELQHGDQVATVELEVINCEPVSQGLLDDDTKWIVLDASECSLDTSVNDQSLRNVYDVSIPGAIAQISGNSSTTLELHKPSLLIADFTLPLKEIWCDKPQENTVQLKVEVDYWKDLHDSLLDSSINEWKLDENDSHCLYVSMEILIALGVQNGSWVKIWVCNDNAKDNLEICGSKLGLDAMPSAIDRDFMSNHEGHENSGRERTDNQEVRTSCHYGQLFAITPPVKALDIYIPQTQQTHVFEMEEYITKTRKTVHISPLLLFNLLQDTVSTSMASDFFLTVAPVTKSEKTEQSEMSSTLFTTSLHFAQDVHLSLINTPSAKPGDTFDESLKRHFSKPRLLTVGDVLCVSYDSAKDVMNSLTAEEFHCVDTIIYFKVKKLVVSGKNKVSCLVDTDHTTVYQTSAVHSYVPIDAHVVCKKDKSNYWKLPSPPGLDVPTRELIGIVKPYLNQNVNMMPAVLITGPGGVGKETIVMAVGRHLGLCTMNINCYDLIGESVAATESRINNVFQRATTCRPCILLLRNINILTKDRDGLDDEPRITNTLQQCINSLKQVTSWPVIAIATSSSPTPLSAQLYSCFLHEVKLQSPSESERKQILEALSSMSFVAPDVSFGLISKRTAGLVLSDFVALFTKAANAACKRVSNRIVGANPEFPNQEQSSKYGFFGRPNSQTDDQTFDTKINQEDLEDAIEIIRAEHSDAIGASKIPSVSWQDIGGLLDVKAELLDTIQLPLQHPELFASGLRRSGVLLYGPPGTGKTLLAKAVATECSLNFLSVKGPELINMYVGQSEENVRQVFSRAHSASPCVIFFDELDSLAPNRGRSGDSGGVMDRVVSQLLAELDGLHKSCDVFVIGATNRPDLLDPALLRPGRFDKLLYLGISEDHQSQMKILEALTKKFELDRDCNLETISMQCPLNFTGADLYALCSDAMLHAIKRMVADQTEVDEEVKPSVKVKAEDFHEALKYLTPSVPEQELQRYKNIQQHFAT